MVIVVLNILVGLMLAYGGAQEAIVSGILGGDLVGLVVGGLGTLTSILLTFSGVSLWRRWRRSRELTFVACGLVVAFSIWAALPPLRLMGVGALLLGAVYPTVVAAYLFRSRGRGAVIGAAGRSSKSHQGQSHGLLRCDGAA